MVNAPARLEDRAKRKRAEIPYTEPGQALEIVRPCNLALTPNGTFRRAAGLRSYHMDASGHRLIGYCRWILAIFDPWRLRLPIRPEVIRLRSLEFTVAARALGLSSGRILLRHILPNLMSAVIVIASLDVACFIIVEAFLSYLGLGVQPPIPSWGGMLGDFRPFMFDRWWLPTFPGTAIFITALAVNLLGDGRRDLLDPYSRGP